MNDNERPWFYQIYVGISREHCLETFGPDAFKLHAAQIMEKLHAAGYHPDVLDP